MQTADPPTPPATAPANPDDAFAAYVLPEVDLLHRVAMSMTRNAAEAEDLVQDTLLRAYRGIGGFDGRFPRAWLLTILRNTHTSRNRRRRPELLRDPDAAMQTMLAAVDVDAEVEHLVFGSMIDDRVTAALDALPENFRTVIALVDMADMTYQEAADALGVPIGTVMSRLHRGRAKLRVALADTDLAPGPGTAKGAA
jgi:RNA polymerase sigma-70 factor (ECF subfamily)